MPSRTSTQEADSRHDSTMSSAAIEFAHQAEKLAHLTPDQETDSTGSTQAVEATFVTAQDPVVVTANGGRLPAVPVNEAIRLNNLRDKVDERKDKSYGSLRNVIREAKDGSIHGIGHSKRRSTQSDAPGAPLRDAIPPSRTNPLFPPLPLYGPPTLILWLQCWFLRCTSSVLSLCFLLVIVLGAFFTSIIPWWKNTIKRLTFRDPQKERPFYEEEKRRQQARQQANKDWKRRKQQEKRSMATEEERITREHTPERERLQEQYVPTEGGPDPLINSIPYYARRVGLDAELFHVQTEDGFIIELYHLYNPLTSQPSPPDRRAHGGPNLTSPRYPRAASYYNPPSQRTKRQYPVLLIHGLLQSAGAYCCNDDASLAYYLAKSGLDVWLGNNRCGFEPKHQLLSYSDPRMWAWNIRQMGVMDLPALISRVLSETGFEKLALVAHSQGTTQTLVALAKEQRPELGQRISVFCALAPAAYAGPLIGKMYFKFMRVVSPGIFRLIFGIHAFIPFMCVMHTLLPGGFYGYMGYRVFSFLFNWTDRRWDRGLRARMFQFAPTYVSAESMRWWLGRECFARQKCILATRQEILIEDEEDENEDKLPRDHHLLFHRGEKDKDEDEEDDEAHDPGTLPTSQTLRKAPTTMSMEEEPPDAADQWQEPGDWETKQEDKDNDAYFNKHHAHPTEQSPSREAKAAHDEATEKRSNQHHDTTQRRAERETPRDAPAGRDNCPVEEPSDEKNRPANDDAKHDRGRYAWYNADAPPMALWVAGADDLVDGRRLLRRFGRGREPHVDVVHAKVVPDYEHLDVIWAVDSIEQVGREVKEVVWATVEEGDRARCRVPEGCEGVEVWAGRGRREERRRRAAEKETEKEREGRSG